MGFPVAARKGAALKMGAAAASLTALLPADSLRVELQAIGENLRSADGTLRGAVQRDNVRLLRISWKQLTPSQAAEVLSACGGDSVTVAYPDPLTGSERTAVFRTVKRNSVCRGGNRDVSLCMEEV